MMGGLIGVWFAVAIGIAPRIVRDHVEARALERAKCRQRRTAPPEIRAAGAARHAASTFSRRAGILEAGTLPNASHWKIYLPSIVGFIATRLEKRSGSSCQSMTGRTL
jgi:hypothetical protein